MTIIVNIKFQVVLVYIHTAYRDTSLQINIVSYSLAPFMDGKKISKKMVRGEKGLRENM